MVEEAKAESIPQHSGSYFARHWRGEHSLPKSWWVNSVLINGLGVGVLFAIVANVTILLFSGSRGVAAILLSVQILLTLVSYVWALVGTWRSASRYQGLKFWSILARILMVLGVVVTVATVSRSIQALDCFLSDPNCVLVVGRGR